MQITMSSIYLGMNSGERVKISSTTSRIDWAVTYGTSGGVSMALSSDETFLVTGSKFSVNMHLGKLSSLNGAVLDSYYHSLNA